MNLWLDESGDYLLAINSQQYILVYRNTQLLLQLTKILPFEPPQVRTMEEESGVTRIISSGSPQVGTMEQESDDTIDSPVEQVRLTVPTADNPSMPALTFRAWLLGMIICIYLSFTNQFFSFRQNSPPISSTFFVILSLPMGKYLARKLPKKLVRIPGTRWTFSLNPGPFSIKEHVLISTLADTASIPYMMEIVLLTKVFYKKDIHILSAIISSFTNQLIGYGFAGFFSKFLVENPYMWWPSILYNVPFFRMLHEKEERCKGKLTRSQFFQIVFICSFSYYIIPNYFFPSLTMMSFICWIWKDSIVAQQIGSGHKGLGLGSFALDWNAISWPGDPLSLPPSTIINFCVGFVATLYIITPIAYWTNTYKARRFPILSSDLFDESGHPYNVTRILDSNTFSFKQQEYDKYSKIYNSTFFAFHYGWGFAATAAVLTHFALFNGREMWCQFRRAHQATQHDQDIHNRLMKKYKTVPQWWYYMILMLMLLLATSTCALYGNELQLPIWGILIAIGFSFILTVPFIVIEATTGVNIGTQTIQGLAIGYLYPGKPLASLMYRVYGVETTTQALFFIGTFKLGHYMKIPPRAMFIVQVIGTIVSTIISISTTYWVLSTVKNICDPKKLPKGSPWTCPYEDQNFSGSVMYGVVGPARMLAPYGVYSDTYLFIIVGVMGPVLVWLLLRYFPTKKWIGHINFPLLFQPARMMPAIAPVNYLSCLTVSIIFNIYVFRKFKDWWARYNYILSMALSIGGSVTTIFMYFAFQQNGIYGINWWGLDVGDHCPLAHCPTDPSVQVDGCPRFH